jgi:F0F1-type ATP synthase beta subunit
VVREGVGARRRNAQALYAHMNNKRKKNKVVLSGLRTAISAVK